MVERIAGANWEDPVQVKTGYRTVVSPSYSTGTEERIALLSRPLRQSSFKMTTRQFGELAHFFADFVLRASGTTDFPLVSDQSEVSSAVSASSSISCPTSYRRFEVGRTVFFLEPKFDGWTFQTRVLQSISVGTITVDSPISLMEGSLVIPSIRSNVESEQDLNLLSDYYGEGDIRGLEVESSKTLPRSATASLSYDFSTWLNWDDGVEATVGKRAYETSLGVGRVVQSYGSTYRLYGFDMSFPSRESFWSLLNFFDSMMGRARSFDFVPPSTPWTGTAESSTLVRASNPYVLSELSRLRIVPGDGSAAIDASISSISNDEITLSSPLSSSVWQDPQTKYLELFEARFNKDELEENWVSDEVVSCPIQVVTL